MSLLKLVNNYRNNLVACNYVIHDEKRLFSSSRLQIELYLKMKQLFPSKAGLFIKLLHDFLLAEKIISQEQSTFFQY